MEIDIPADNKVICFVGENGSNKSSIISYLYSLVRQSSYLQSPSDKEDIFTESTFDISQESKERYYNVSTTISDGKSASVISGAAVSDYKSLDDETMQTLKAVYRQEFSKQKTFMKRGVGNPLLPAGKDLVEESVLLYRPSNRFELTYYEQASTENNDNWGNSRNVVGHRRFPFKVQSGITEASSYFLDVILDYFVAMNSKTPSFNLHSYFSQLLKEIDPEFSQIVVRPFPDKGIASKNLPTLSSLSAGQSDWLVTAINILVQIAEVSSRGGTFSKDIKEVSGIVFIDEMDKNFHPKLQETILPWFTESFPNIQFVISTHSPYLIRSLDDKSFVIKLPEGELINEDFTYWDINEVSAKVFGRDLGFTENVQKELSALKKAFRENNQHGANTIYRKLKGKSESLDQELTRIVFTLGSSDFIETLDA